MGLFTTISRSIRRRREARRIVRRFSSYVDPSTVERILNETLAPDPPPEQTDINFVVMLIADDDLAELPARLGRAFDILVAPGVFVESGSKSLVFASFGMLPNCDQSVAITQRGKAVVELQKQLANQVRIVHGRTPGLFGNINCGSKFGFRYGSALRDFGAILGMLTKLKPGEAWEWIEGNRHGQNSQ
ncbi:MAG TPA: hypothetical protein VFE47_23935 [Tepidisphaeraceae bacterium]|nr:hypothetical protein [Tepidisphaeraceae bacterium]